MLVRMDCLFYPFLVILLKVQLNIIGVSTMSLFSNLSWKKWLNENSLSWLRIGTSICRRTTYQAVLDIQNSRFYIQNAVPFITVILVWFHSKAVYPEISKRTARCLLPFSFTYLSETMFLILYIWKTITRIDLMWSQIFIWNYPDLIQTYGIWRLKNTYQPSSRLVLKS